ncbi:DUF1684 domain-containing protein [Bifidobacterium amazonense]|uniref:DUF1684 domain-containing protein n=1 Tax=Bifidobacterium amazonense TaxID=2809027 RepID=A0ABS9VYX1_9BIFI|nr:DUF1684 domain-containing protein [Bifidobacterium amazonense]MCH9277189.1 DUF1684 domain-containing protein [Bifidobacterium amazonense]
MVSYQNISSQSDREFADAWRRWHDDKDRQFASEYGFLSVIGLDWLHDGETVAVPDFPGEWRQDGDTVTYTPQSGKVVTVNTLPLNGPRGYITPTDEDANVVDIVYRDVKAELIKRIGGTDHYAVRVRDPQAPKRLNFKGTPYFEPNRKWVVPATYVPYETVTDVTVDASLSYLNHVEQAIGELEFELDGKPQRLVVFQGHGAGRGLVLFRDGTSGKESYGGARVLTFDVTDPKSVDHIDFNRATNLPCAYSQYCTCPLAPASNTLAVAVTAGEKLPAEHDF